MFWQLCVPIDSFSYRTSGVVRRVVQNSLIWIALAANRSFRGLSLVPNCGREQRSKNSLKKKYKDKIC